MYSMDKFSAIMWVNILKGAKMGDNSSIDELNAENKIRIENGHLTVEEELKTILKDAYDKI